MPLMRDLDNPHHPTALVIFKRVKAGQPIKDHLGWSYSRWWSIEGPREPCLTARFSTSSFTLLTQQSSGPLCPRGVQSVQVSQQKTTTQMDGRDLDGGA